MDLMSCTLSKNGKRVSDAFADVSPREDGFEFERWMPGHSPLAFDNYDREEPLEIARARLAYDVIFEVTGNPWQGRISLRTYVDAEKIKGGIKKTSYSKRGGRTRTFKLTIDDELYIIICRFND